jgi:hypothetical protein
MPKPRYDFRDSNKERLKKISLSSTSLPPLELFPTESKTNNLPAITGGNFYNSQDNINDDLYNFYDTIKSPETRHPSLEYFDDFYPIENQFLFEPTDDENDYGPPQQLTTTTTIASFKCHTQTQQTTVTIYQTHNRASSL